MQPADNGVLITIHRGEKLLSQKEVVAEKNIPATLVKLVSSYPVTTTGYSLSYPTAQKLKDVLFKDVSDSFQVDSQALDKLREVSCPSEFRIRWHFDATHQALVRSIGGAEGHLGGGWFYEADRIWYLDVELSSEMISWISKTYIGSNELLAFVTRGIEQHRSPHLLCDLSLATDFRAKLTIVNTLKHSLDIQITTTIPELRKQLIPLGDDDQTLISGTTLIPNWGRVLRGKLLEAARTAQTLRIESKLLPGFIQDELIPNAQILDCNISQLQQQYSIEDAAKVPLSCKLDHQVVRGIGRYKALPCLSILGEMIPVEKLTRMVEDGTRFYRLENGWLEITPEFRSRCAEWQEKKLAPVTLSPSEIIGAVPDRLNKLNLHPPAINVPHDDNEQQQAHLLIDAMRRHGLPVGLYGLQQQMNSILSVTCARLFRDDKRAKILWLVSSRKKNAVRDTLKQNRIAIDEKLEGREGHISLATPENNTLIAGSEWSLIIYSDLDVLASGDNQAKFYASIRRMWSIGVFSQENWYHDQKRAHRALQALGLSSSSLEAFLRACMGTYTKQADTLLARIASPFKKIVLGEEAAPPDTGSVPIPPRPIPGVLPANANLKEVFRPSFTVSVETSSFSDSFLEQAKRYVNATYPETDPVSFMHYFPTYSSMTQQQRDWYFYWRSQVRRGNYLAADLSYLFVYIYEILHCVGFKDEQAAFDQLVNIWQQYRALYNRLDGYLIDWITDFAIVYKLPHNSMAWYAQVLDVGGRLTDDNLAIEAWLSRGLPYSQLPEPLLELVSEYKPTKSKFYQQYNGDSSVSRDLRQALELISNHLYQQSGKTLFEYYRPTQMYTIRRVPFASAIYDGERKEITIANIPAWTTASELQTAITAILKYCENLLRRQRSFKGALRGIEITPEWSSVLDAAFPNPNVAEPTSTRRRAKPAVHAGDIPQPSSPTSFSIDYSRVAALGDESIDLTKRLTVDENDVDYDSVEISSTEVPVPNTSEPVAFSIQLNVVRPEDTPAHLLTDLREVAEVVAHDQTAVMLLQHFTTNGWELPEGIVETLLAGEFLSMVLDRINERALELLGDNLLLIENGLVIVAEDYRDEAGHLFKSAEPMLLPSSTEAISKPEYDELTPEWSTFASLMQSRHWEALNVLLSGDDIKIKLDGIARSTYTTADLLIDEINEFALMSIGDIVIESGDSPAVEDEDVDNLRLLMAWVLEHQLQEQ